MKRMSLLAIAVPLALAWAIPCAAADATPPARSASASDGAASAAKHKRPKRKKVVVHKARAASDALPVVKLRPAPHPIVQTRAVPVVNIPAPSPPPPAAGPSVIGPSAAASAGGPGFAVIPNPVGAAASSPPRPDAGATTDPRMR